MLRNGCSASTLSDPRWIQPQRSGTDVRSAPSALFAKTRNTKQTMTHMKSLILAITIALSGIGLAQMPAGGTSGTTGTTGTTTGQTATQNPTTSNQTNGQNDQTSTTNAQTNQLNTNQSTGTSQMTTGTRRSQQTRSKAKRAQSTRGQVNQAVLGNENPGGH